MKKSIVIIIAYIIFIPIIRAQGVAKGTEIDLTGALNLNVSGGQFAQMFIPDYFAAPADGKYTLIFHFHSASWAAEDEVYKANANAILFNIHLGAFSSPYKNYFSDTTKFSDILDLVNKQLSDRMIVINPEIKNLVLTSFSAGYAGVREILKTSEYYNKIDALTLADGLHSDLDPSVMAEQMKNFLRFAKDARDGKKIMLLTHSNILTYTYANTTETADYLIKNIGAERTPVNITDNIGHMYSVCDTGRFHVRGYRGDTATDHLKHLYNMNMMLETVIAYLDRTTGLKKKMMNKLEFKLNQNYPNPFYKGSFGDPTTTIKYSIPSSLLGMHPDKLDASPQSEIRVTLKVYDILGREVTTLVNNQQSPGNYEVNFDASSVYGGLTSGIYFYTLRAGNYIETRKMQLLK